MRDFPNIEKSAFHKGQYVGYGANQVWRITKSTSSFGNWCCRSLSDHSRYFLAFGLSSISKQLERECDAPRADRKADGDIPPLNVGIVEAHKAYEAERDSMGNRLDGSGDLEG